MIGGACSAAAEFAVPKVQTSSAERAAVAAKTARRRRWERKQWWGKSAAIFSSLPLLFAAVWIRVGVSDALRTRDCVLRYRSKGRVLAVASIYRDVDSLREEAAMEAGGE